MGAEIVYRPWKQIVVHEIQELEVQDFLSMVVANFEVQKQLGDPGVQWTDGIAFVIGFMQETPELIKEKLQGILHYGLVQFTRTSYQDQKKLSFSGRERSVRLIKAENNPDLVNLAKFLQTFKK